LDTETATSAHRAVRRQAVANALEAANDFADALGGAVGALITLADPGLLSAGAPSGNAHVPTRAAGAYLASATSGTAWDERVDIDPSVITVSASVEASYEVNLD
ncbi:MAG TPA: SIMPL domain-containing protein, partial [Acidimicrobiales bacterium]